MSLHDLIRELFAENGKFEFSALLAPDCQKLSAAYILENEDIIFDLFANVHQTSLAHHFASLYAGVDECDVFDMAQDIRNAMIRSNDLEVVINCEIERLWPAYELEREQRASEAA